MALDELVDVLRKADENPNKTARDKKVGAMLCELLLLPVAERAKSVGLEVDSCGAHSSSKPHHVQELKLVVPGREQMIPQLRIALTQYKKEEEKALGYALGATVCQRSEAKGGPYPPHVRWGLWTDAPMARERIPGPFRLIAGKMDWSESDIISRPMNNMARGWLSFLGKYWTVDELDKWASFEELADDVAKDLVGLSNVIRKT